jgi:hypothetical protein
MIREQAGQLEIIRTRVCLFNFNYIIHENISKYAV